MLFTINLRSFSSKTEGFCWSSTSHSYWISVYNQPCPHTHTHTHCVCLTFDLQMCSACQDPGATLGCFFKGCPNKYHYRCALQSGKSCSLIFISLSLTLSYTARFSTPPASVYLYLFLYLCMCEWGLQITLWLSVVGVEDFLWAWSCCCGRLNSVGESALLHLLFSLFFLLQTVSSSKKTSPWSVKSTRWAQTLHCWRHMEQKVVLKAEHWLRMICVTPQNKTFKATAGTRSEDRWQRRLTQHQVRTVNTFKTCSLCFISYSHTFAAQVSNHWLSFIQTRNKCVDQSVQEISYQNKNTDLESALKIWYTD